MYPVYKVLRAGLLVSKGLFIFNTQNLNSNFIIIIF